MALIKCPECGKEISDKAFSCPHCGFPINCSNDKNDVYSGTYNIILQAAYGNKIETIKYIKNTLCYDLVTAKKFVDEAPSILKKNVSHSDANKIKNHLETYGAKIILEPYSETQDDNALLEKNKLDILACPRCGSTAITTGQRGFSIVTGFLGSNKTVNRCGKCGYSWQPK